MGKPKKKKPQSKIDIFKTVVEILAGIANIVLVVYTILKGYGTGEGKPPQPLLLYPIALFMSKIKLSNSVIYLLFFANCVYAVGNGTSWLFYVSAALTGIVFFLDVWEVIRHVRK